MKPRLDPELSAARTGLTAAQYRALLKRSPARRGGKETDVLRACLELLRLRGIYAWRSNNAGVHRTSKDGKSFWSFAGLKGVSDILGILNDGRFLAIEIKAPGKVPTSEQRLFLKAISDRRGVALWITNVDQLNKEIGTWGV